ncbi:c-type cytochrome [Cesiribacter andamanensis]|uniref:Cytochrome c, mono-and diheme variant n=1 Tax=Cesiribacter andamanensis AMV16 TaxID=1279009 RepID=M7NMP2_9BACT|nr:c-type cytochrome [Cesiribacter andamanensis]EMR03040.1 Cytochrome c, mono- and diheme variant [Cesiribacter andamanensis AMV16]
MSENHLDMLEESVSKPALLRSGLVLMVAGLLWFGSIPALAQGQSAGAPTQQDVEAAAVPSADAVPATQGDAGGIPTSDEAISAGAALFKNNCQQCHAIEQVVVGPALKNIHTRRPVEWTAAFIRNSQKLIQSGDAYAVNLYNQYNKTQMPSFNFNDEEIMSLLAYIKAESDSPTGTGTNQASPGQGGEGVAPAESAATPGYITAILVVLGIVLVLVLVVLVLVLAVLRRYLNQRTDLDAADREIIDRRMSFRSVVSSKPFLFLVIFIFTAVVFKNVIDGLYQIGVQQGYAPTQPIAFSHKLHAGTYQIDCNYCHTGAYKAKSANIPSVNICMNCHNSIGTDRPEIKKLYAAVENNQPIQWVRIHNLPDLAYFNHAQHTSVGGIECQTCHGPIQEMEVVYQYSKLTMGWCINCHRDTEVKTEGNDYYDKLVQLHNEAEAGGKLRVKDIGGMECSRCHY